MFLHSKRSIKQQHKEKLSLLAERDNLIVFGCRRRLAVAADVCLRTVVVLGLQLLVQAERAGALHGREHGPVQVENVRFRLQEGLDGSGIHALCLKLSLHCQVHIHNIRFRLQESLNGSSKRALCVELSLCLPVLL